MRVRNGRLASVLGAAFCRGKYSMLAISVLVVPPIKMRKAARCSGKPLSILLVLAMAASVLFAAPALSQTVSCTSANSDSDGDGWGWESGASCRVDPVTTAFQDFVAESRNDQPTQTQCAGSFDADGDGWGWENNTSCVVR